MVTYLFPPDFGGAIVQALRLSHELRKQGHQVSFLTDNGNKESEKQIYENFPIHKLKTYSNNQRSFLKQLLWAFQVIIFAIKNPEFKIFHFHSVRGPELIAMPFLRLLNRKTIFKLTLAESDDPLTLSQRRLLGRPYNYCLKKIERIIAISPILQRMSISAGISEEKIVLVPNGVNLKKFHAPSQSERLELRKKLNFNEKEKIIISIGSIEHRKGYDYLIPAFKYIKEAIPEAKLLIIGPGNNKENEYFKELLDIKNNSEIKDILFLGQREDIPDFMMAADLFAFCSRQEGLPNVLLEACCSGLSVATMHIDGITDWIVKGRETAINCYSREPRDFATACITLLNGSSALLTKTESEKAALDFGIESVAKVYDELYAKLDLK